MGCFICGTESFADLQEHAAVLPYKCERCGLLIVTDDARTALIDLRKEVGPIKVDAVSHFIRQSCDSASGKPVYVNFHNVLRWFRDPEIALKPPGAQARNLVVWLGTRRVKDFDPAVNYTVSVGELASIIGAKNDYDATDYVVQHLTSENVLEVAPEASWTMKGTRFKLRLTFKGWERFDELQREQADSRRAFMAMAFENSKLEDVYERCFKPAAEDAGFTLDRMTDGQGAGLIDAQLRVRIRTAKFLVADLSTENRGAYWEAGFAEGLGRHVIYVCEKAIWEHEDPAKRPHFDTNHLTTVVWSYDNLPLARQRLANMIRDTFPAVALMSGG